MAFDLCAFYMAQIGEASKMLTDDTQNFLTCINAGVLKAYIFSMIEPSAITEIKNRINYCNENAE